METLEINNLETRKQMEKWQLTLKSKERWNLSQHGKANKKQAITFTDSIEDLGIALCGYWKAEICRYLENRVSNRVENMKIN